MLAPITRPLLIIFGLTSFKACSVNLAKSAQPIIVNGTLAAKVPNALPTTNLEKGIKIIASRINGILLVTFTIVPNIYLHIYLVLGHFHH